MSFPRNSRSRRSSGPPQAPTTGGYYGSSVPLDRSEVSPSAQETLVFHCYPCGKRFQVSIDRTVRTAKSGERVELRCPGCDAIVGWSTEDAIQDNISEMRIMGTPAILKHSGSVFDSILPSAYASSAQVSSISSRSPPRSIPDGRGDSSSGGGRSASSGGGGENQSRSQRGIEARTPTNTAGSGGDTDVTAARTNRTPSSAPARAGSAGSDNSGESYAAARSEAPPLNIDTSTVRSEVPPLNTDAPAVNVPPSPVVRSEEYLNAPPSPAVRSEEYLNVPPSPAVRSEDYLNAPPDAPAVGSEGYSRVPPPCTDSHQEGCDTVPRQPAMLSSTPPPPGLPTVAPSPHVPHRTRDGSEAERNENGSSGRGWFARLKSLATRGRRRGRKILGGTHLSKESRSPRQGATIEGQWPRQGGGRGLESEKQKERLERERNLEQAGGRAGRGEDEGQGGVQGESQDEGQGEGESAGEVEGQSQGKPVASSSADGQSSISAAQPMPAPPPESVAHGSGEQSSAAAAAQPMPTTLPGYIAHGSGNIGAAVHQIRQAIVRRLARREPGTQIELRLEVTSNS